MEAKNQIKLEISLISGEKSEIKTKKIFYGSVFFIFLSVLGTLSAWFLRTTWQKIAGRLKALKQSLTPQFSSREAHLRAMFLLVALNLCFWGWLNKEDIFLTYEPLIKIAREASFPIALGKTEEGVILGSEDAVKIDDLQKKSSAENSEVKLLREDKKIDLSLTEERCQKNKLEGKSSELCGKYEKDATLEKELKKIDDQAKAKMAAARNPIERRVSCAEKNDHPQKSQQGKGKHTDEDCCPDPDEYPKPGCVYSPAGYALMLKR
jgi:hypothetical protein